MAGYKPVEWADLNIAEVSTLTGQVRPLTGNSRPPTVLIGLPTGVQSSGQPPPPYHNF